MRSSNNCDNPGGIRAAERGRDEVVEPKKPSWLKKKQRILPENEEVRLGENPWRSGGISSMQAILAEALADDPDLTWSMAEQILETNHQSISRIANTLRRKGVIVKKRRQES